MKFQPLLKQLAKYKYVLLVIALGFVLLLWPNAPPKNEATSDTALQTENDTLAAELEAALSHADGVGRVSVLLTRKKDMETLYLSDQDVKDKRQWEGGALTSYEQNADNSTVMREEAGGGEQPLISSRIYPIYQGALVVCDGADNAAVRQSIMEAVASVTGLGYDKISVVKRTPEANTNSQ